MVERLLAKTLDIPDISHGFFTRRGGVSGGMYAALNVGRGSDDDAAHVAENRERVRRLLGAASLCTPYQVHGARAVRAGLEFDAARPPEADALVTDIPGVAVGVVTADCVPVLLADPEAGVVAAAHAGWRGTLAGVVESTLTLMETLGARRNAIRAAVGPAIAQDSYEVGEELRDAFLAGSPGDAARFRSGARPGKFLFDLPGTVAARLAAAGVSADLSCARDTLADEARFFSYRRTTQRGEPDYGRQMSAILRLR